MIVPADLEDIRLDLEAAEQERKAAVTSVSKSPSLRDVEEVTSEMQQASTAAGMSRDTHDSSRGLARQARPWPGRPV